MERSSSFGTSWEDQCDYSNPDPVPQRTKTSTNKGGNTVKYGKKVGEGLGKTKAVASTGFKKVKEGTTVGFHWIKDKCHKTTQKN